MVASDARVYNSAPWICGMKPIPIQTPARNEELMSETGVDDFASRAATYFVFIFLIAAIVETLLASFGG